MKVLWYRVESLTMDNWHERIRFEGTNLGYKRGSYSDKWEYHTFIRTALPGFKNVYPIKLQRQKPARNKEERKIFASIEEFREAFWLEIL